MEAVIRDIRKRADGTEEYTDSQFCGDEISLGSAPDQTIQLLGNEIRAQHAVIRFRGSRPVVSCRDGRAVSVNGADKRSATLSPSDLVSVGGHKIRFFQVPRGFDIAITVERDPNVDPTAFERAFKTDIDQTWLSKRAVSWLLFLAVPVLTMAAPLLGLKLEQRGAKTPAWLPDDSLWSSGTLLEAHRFETGDNCAACHQKLFTRVRDEACLECHLVIENHVSDAVHQDLPEMQQTPQCAICHREHNEPPQIVVATDQLCTACHAGNKSGFAALALDSVSRFASKDHPEFEVHLNTPQAVKAGTGLDFSWTVQEVALSSAKEESNLAFTHALHLGGDKITNAAEEALQCSDCHTLERQGEHFLPMTMELTCASSACHDLRFDTDIPDRKLPHGEPLEVMLALEALFLRMYSNPEFEAVVKKRRRRPDDTPPVELCTGLPLACATRDAAAEIDEQFTKKGCVTCHKIEDTRTTDIYTRFQVHPVRLNEDYLKNTYFPHDSHRVMDKLTGDDACLKCHEVSESESSQDLLLPGLDNCLECHGEDSPERVSASCVACHGYHPERPASNERLEVRTQ